jgi:hypothetical protein
MYDSAQPMTEAVADLRTPSAWSGAIRDMEREQAVRGVRSGCSRNARDTWWRPARPLVPIQAGVEHRYEV